MRELTPKVMSWGQRKNLRMALGKVVGRVEALREAANKNGNPGQIADAMGSLLTQSAELQEALLVEVYKLTPDEVKELQDMSPRDVLKLVTDFLELNNDPEAKDAEKKAADLVKLNLGM